MNGIDLRGYSYLGVAVKHPIQLYYGGRPVMSVGAAAVEQSIRHILDTPIGSLFFKPEYGSNIYKLIFRANSESLWGLLKIYSKEAIEEWEPRISNVEVRITSQDDTCLVHIDYKLKGRNEVNSMIYPFYRNLK